MEVEVSWSTGIYPWRLSCWVITTSRPSSLCRRLGPHSYFLSWMSLMSYYCSPHSATRNRVVWRRGVGHVKTALLRPFPQILRSATCRSLRSLGKIMGMLAWCEQICFDKFARLRSLWSVVLVVLLLVCVFGDSTSSAYQLSRGWFSCLLMQCPAAWCMEILLKSYP